LAQGFKAFVLNSSQENSKDALPSVVRPNEGFAAMMENYQKDLVVAEESGDADVVRDIQNSIWLLSELMGQKFVAAEISRAGEVY
jgi:hypothetical protein